MNATQLMAMVGAQPGLVAVGVVYLGRAAADQTVVRRPAGGGTNYLVIEDTSGDGRSVNPSDPGATAGRLRALGVNVGQLTVRGVTLDGFRVSSSSGEGNFGDTPGLNGGDMVAQMAAMNMQFLALQEAIQMESRRFFAMSNASSARHQTALNTIKNFRG